MELVISGRITTWKQSQGLKPPPPPPVHVHTLPPSIQSTSQALRVGQGRAAHLVVFWAHGEVKVPHLVRLNMVENGDCRGAQASRQLLPDLGDLWSIHDTVDVAARQGMQQEQWRSDGGLRPPQPQPAARATAGASHHPAPR